MRTLLAFIFVLALWYDLLQRITSLIGATLPTSTLFFLGLVFLILIAIQFSVKVSLLHNQVKNVAQENALLKNRVEEMEEEHSPADSNGKRNVHYGKEEKRKS